MENIVGALLVGGAAGVAASMLLALVLGNNRRKKPGGGSPQFAINLKRGVKDYTSSLRNRFTAHVDDIAQKSHDTIHTVALKKYSKTQEVNL